MHGQKKKQHTWKECQISSKKQKIQKWNNNEWNRTKEWKNTGKKREEKKKHDENIWICTPFDTIYIQIFLCFFPSATLHTVNYHHKKCICALCLWCQTGDFFLVLLVFSHSLTLRRALSPRSLFKYVEKKNEGASEWVCVYLCVYLYSCCCFRCSFFYGVATGLIGVLKSILQSSPSPLHKRICCDRSSLFFILPRIRRIRGSIQPFCKWKMKKWKEKKKEKEMGKNVSNSLWNLSMVFVGVVHSIFRNRSNRQIKKSTQKKASKHLWTHMHTHATK